MRTSKYGSNTGRFVAITTNPTQTDAKGQN